VPVGCRLGTPLYAVCPRRMFGRGPHTYPPPRRRTVAPKPTFTRWVKAPPPEIPRGALELIEQAKLAVGPMAEAEWFAELVARPKDAPEPEGWLYVYRIGNGALEPHVLFVVAVPSDPSRPVSPSWDDLHSVVSELTLEGAIVQPPGLVAGIPYELEDGGVQVLVLQQVGALDRSPAARRRELSGGQATRLVVPAGGA